CIHKAFGDPFDLAVAAFRERRKKEYTAKFVPIDCKDYRESGHTYTGVYEIYPFGTTLPPIRVYCDMDTLAGGWTAIQKRIDGSLTFDKKWDDYKNGFGATEQNLWIGDRMLDTGDLNTNLSEMSFSTLDRDHDRCGWCNCAVDHGGGWWYNGCHDANLNGKWSPEEWWEPWYPPLKNGSDITETLIMIRRH
ncbi:fibrinogen beta chain-like, partial [Saccostrea cucullata]|uniref:fibrinogen beta chain-like n=1 Tax=Saccostrea cuccullata TaxID=36930 RepID=UPI002ED38C5F